MVAGLTVVALAETSFHTIPAADAPFPAADIRSSGLLRHRGLSHFLFWLFYYGLTILLYLSIHQEPSLFFFTLTFLTVMIQAGYAYLNLYVLIPRLLFTKRYGYYILALLAATMACSATYLLMEREFILLIEKRPEDKMAIFSLRNFSIECIMQIFVFGLTTGIKFGKYTILSQERQKEKEKHYLETELKFLKSQIQPHFFFNTLNNIYSLTLKKSEQAPEIILKLSDLMSYMLYDSTAPLVPLSKEIDYLQNYLDVEQLRFGQRLSVTFTIEGCIESANIPPMILILFLENSFKHGVKNNISRIQLTILLQVTDNELFFRVENPASEEEKASQNNGIGLRNVRRRLDLLYGQHYSLDISEENRLFIVSLKMPLC